MSIYSTNRMGYSSSAAIVANENYKSNDIGRILCEAQANDAAMFEAIVISDLQECYALREGTLLESEVRALNEASVKAFFERLKERLKAFWGKIKGAFKAAIRNIAALVLKGDAFLKNFEKNYKGNANASVKIKLFDSSKIAIPSIDSLESSIEAFRSEEGIDKARVIGKGLANALGNSSGFVAAGDWKDTVAQECYAIQTLNVNKLKDLVSKRSEIIKKLGEDQKKLDKALSDALKKIKEMEKESEKNSAEIQKNIQTASAVVHGLETVVSLTTKASIAGAKSNVAAARKALTKLMNDSNKEDKAFGESAVDEAEETVEMELDDSVAAATDADIQEEIDEIEAAATDESVAADVD